MTGFAIGIAAACVAAAVWWVMNHRFQSPWARAAERLGLELHGSTLLGQVEGIDVGLRLPRSTGPSSLQETAHLHCRMPLPLDLGLSIRPRSAAAAGYDHGGEEVSSGDDEVDEQIAIFADEASRLEPLLRDGDLLPALVELAAVEADFFVIDDGVHVDLEAVSTAPRRLGEAVQAAVRVVQHLERLRHDLPVSSALAEHRRGWAAVAGALELELSTAPLAVAGLLDGVRVAARVRRVTDTDYCLVVTVRFSESLRLGLAVSQQRRRRRRRAEGQHAARRRQRFSTLFDEEKHLTSVRFRRTFDVRAEEVWAADQLFDQAVQGALLALAADGASVRLHDHALRVTYEQVPALREPLEHRVRTVAVAGRLIEQRALGHLEERRGPYR